MTKRILVVDDEPSITTLLKYNLEKEHFEVDIAYDGEVAIEMATSLAYDFIILDLMLPRVNGIDVTKHLRHEKIETPIIMLTAKDEVVDKIIGLEVGADDYLTKPFSPKELIARIRAVERRLDKINKSSETSEEKETLTIGDIKVYPKDYRVFKGDEEVTLTKKEFELLLYFMRRQDRIIGRDELMQTIWQDDMYHLSRTVDIHVSHLREKLEVDPKKPVYIKTVRGFGYKFQEPVQ